ncbi:MAG TPA: hypothetical protein DCW29_00275 [Janthinobacterium sp.]|nr:hypothetical protein [Janthinobacterium sp.]
MAANRKIWTASVRGVDDRRCSAIRQPFLENASMSKKLVHILSMLLLALLGVFCFQTAHAAGLRQEAGGKQQALAQTERSTTTQARTEDDSKQAFTLEVLGIGLSVPGMRDVTVWDAIEKTPRALVLSTDPKDYPWGSSEKLDVYMKWDADAVEHAASWFVEKWSIPVLAAGPAYHDPRRKDYLDDAVSGSLSTAGMHWHQVQAAANLADDYPEALLTRVFDFFEQNPQVPAVILFGSDTLATRGYLQGPGKPALVTNGEFKKSDLFGAVSALVLVRRDRVDALRPYAIDATTGRPVKQAGPAPAHPFQPSPWLPKPWTTLQLEQFDALPTLGYLHRPQTVSMLDADKHPLPPKAKNEAFRQGWLDALRAMPPATKVKRVFYDVGAPDQGGRIVPLAQTLATETDLDAMQAGQGFNLTTNLADTGAASPFVQIALGLYASYRHNDVSASVNIKRNDSASIILISPPLVKKAHPGGDPLGFGLAQ